VVHPSSDSLILPAKIHSARPCGQLRKKSKRNRKDTQEREKKRGIGEEHMEDHHKEEGESCRSPKYNGAPSHLSAAPMDDVDGDRTGNPRLPAR